MTKTRGRPRLAPKRVTVSLSQQHADELERLAGEAQVTLSAFCAHILERYAFQDHELMTNDVIAQRLENLIKKSNQEFADRFGYIMLRNAHETLALRRQMIMLTTLEQGETTAKELADLSWREAVAALRPQKERVLGEADERQSTGSEEHS